MRSPFRRRAAIAAATLLAVAATPAVPGLVSADADPADDPSNASTNMEYVAQVLYPERDGNDSNVDEQGGTDLELATLTVLADDPDTPEVETEERDYAVAGTYRNGFQMVDVTDPENPALVATYDCHIVQGDIQVMTRPDLVDENGLARTFVTYAIDSAPGTGMNDPCITDLEVTNPEAFDEELGNGLGSLIFEITDPTDPITVGFINAAGGTHNGTIQSFDTDGDGVIDDWLFYNSESDAGGTMQVWDLVDPTSPELVTTLTVQGSGTNTHDVTFNADGTRAYVASISNSYILDTTDPRDPQFVVAIVDPANGIHHQIDPITLDSPLGERTYVIISDEIAGASGNGYCPGGGMHIWDVTVETAPVKVGAYFMPDITVQEGAGTGAGGLVTCTSHVYRMYPEHGIMTIGNMGGGVRVIDVSNLIGLSAGAEDTSTGQVAGMRDLGWWRFTGSGEDGSDSWAFKAHPDRFEVDADGNVSFYAFSNDQTRGLEVYRFDGTKPAAEARADQTAERGWMATVEQAQARWNSLDIDEDALLLYSCRFPSGLLGALDGLDD